MRGRRCAGRHQTTTAERRCLCEGLANAAGLVATISDGTPGRIRTCDLLLRRQALYPAELRAQPSSSQHTAMSSSCETSLTESL